MAVTRLCFFLTVLVSVKMIAAQPIFGTSMWCDLMCTDDDDDDYSDGGLLDFLFFDPCGDCTTSNKPSKKPSSTTAQPLNVVINPSEGMNVTMTNTGMGWLMNFMPWPRPATTTRAPSTTAAPGTTAAGTTAAGTTAAGGAKTTKAPTTAAG